MKKSVMIKVDPEIHNEIRNLIKQRKLKDQGINNISKFYELSAKLMLRLLEQE